MGLLQGALWLVTVALSFLSMLAEASASSGELPDAAFAELAG
jgi:hypothetical protein